MSVLKKLKIVRTKDPGNGKTGSYLRYALGEIILIVIGIFVAMQINNWNEARKNKLANDQLLQLAQEEILQIGSTLDRDMVYRDTLPMVYKKFVDELALPDSPENHQNIENLLKSLFRTTAYTFAQNSITSYITNTQNDNSQLNREIIRLHDYLTDLELISKRGFDMKFENFYGGFGDDVDVSKLKLLSFKTIKTLDFRNKITMNAYVEEEISVKFDQARNQKVLVDSLIHTYLKI